MEDVDDKYEKKNPFTVPDGYFDGLTERVMMRVEEERKRSGKRRRFVLPGRSYMKWAAVWVGVLFTAQVFYGVIAGRPLWGEDEDKTEQAGKQPESGEKDIFDRHFNPTNDEIIEYLAAEVENYEWMIAGIY